MGSQGQRGWKSRLETVGRHFAGRIRLPRGPGATVKYGIFGIVLGMGVTLALAGVHPMQSNRMLQGQPPAGNEVADQPSGEPDAGTPNGLDRLADLGAGAIPEVSLQPPNPPLSGEKGGSVAAAATLPEVVNLAEIVWPVTGEVAQSFGWYRHPETQEWRFQSSVRITPHRSDASVRSALSGIVASVASDAEGYRVRVLHAEGWESEVIGLASVEVAVGDWVGAGDPLGLFGATPTRTDLFFAMYRNGEPVNPEDYLYRW